MLQQFYAESGLMFWPLLGMGILAVVFLLVMGYAIFGLRKSPMVSRMAWLPLENDLESDGAEEARTHE
jgi:hypothetical protein